MRLGYLCIAAALALFALCLANGQPNRVAKGSASWDRLDVELADATPNYSALLAYARTYATGTDEQKALRLLDIVERRFAHGASEESLTSSYPAALAGIVHPAFKTTFEPDRILRTGNLGLCSQQSYILLRLANDLGLPARHVGLTGHVVTEVWYGGAWHMLDPDRERVIRDAGGNIVSVASLTTQPAVVHSAYDDRGRTGRGISFPTVFLSREDNFVAPRQGRYFEWQSNALLYLTTALDLAKWIIPVLLLLFGAWQVARNSRRGRNLNRPSRFASPFNRTTLGGRRTM